MTNRRWLAVAFFAAIACTMPGSTGASSPLLESVPAGHIDRDAGAVNEYLTPDLRSECLYNADCDDGLDCTIDTCDEVSEVCTNDLDVGTCLIGDQCYEAYELNLANDCEVCDPDTASWRRIASSASCWE